MNKVYSVVSSIAPKVNFLVLINVLVCKTLTLGGTRWKNIEKLYDFSITLKLFQNKILYIYAF